AVRIPDQPAVLCARNDVAGTTGVPVLLNTSFNKQKTTSPGPRRRSRFLRTGMDTLALGNFYTRDRPCPRTRRLHRPVRAAMRPPGAFCPAWVLSVRGRRLLHPKLPWMRLEPGSARDARRVGRDGVEVHGQRDGRVIAHQHDHVRDAFV